MKKYFILLFLIIVFAIGFMGCSQPDPEKIKAEREWICERFKNVEAGDFIKFKNEGIWLAVQRIRKSEENVSIYLWTSSRVLQNFENEQLRDVEEIVMRNCGDHAKWENIAIRHITSHP